MRKNVARAHATEVLQAGSHDPWTAFFNAAATVSREEGISEVVPYWVYNPGIDGARIERHVPLLPLSRDAAHLERLIRSLATYRLAFGQPRQEELLAFLQDRVDPELLKRLVDDLRIDLTPRPE